MSCVFLNSPDYNVEFFRKFMLVMNALDNRGKLTWDYFSFISPFVLSPDDESHSFLPPAARNHVNRMCLAADIPLIESGTAGYLGQVTVIKKVNVHTFIWQKTLKTLIFSSPCSLSLSLLTPGNDGVLWVPAKAGPENFPRMHHQKHAVRAHSLHRLGQVSLQVRLAFYNNGHKIVFLLFWKHSSVICGLHVQSVSWLWL